MIDYENIAKQNQYVLIEQADLVELLKEVRKINPTVILEIGTRQGFSFRAFLQAFSPEIAITIDILQKAEMPAPGMIPEIDSSGVHYLWGHDSTKSETQFKVMSLLKGKMIDFLFIDGDHALETVERDFQLYAPFVRKGGIIAMHDIAEVLRDGDNRIEAKIVFDRVKQNLKHKVINTGKTPALAIPSGIGLLFV